MNLIALILFLPLAGLFVNLLFGWKLGEKFAGWVASAFISGAFLAAVGGFVRLIGLPMETRLLHLVLFEWIPIGGFQVNAGFMLDPLSSIMTLVITGVGMYFFYTQVGITPVQISEYADWLHLTPIILAHAALGTPFVVITVTATLVGFDHSLTRASASLGADGLTTFFKVTVPLVLPGMISGALFAFITSFDEVVIVLFLAGAEEYTIPRQMFSGIREQISPTILAVATVLVVLSIVLLTVLEGLRRRNERMRGMSPG